MLTRVRLAVAAAAAMTAVAPHARAAPPGPAAVFEAYEAAVKAGDRDAVAALVGADPAPTPFAFCRPDQSRRDCLVDYLDKTVVDTHSVITPIAVHVDGDTVEARLEVRNDLTRAAGVDRLAGTDRIKVTDGRIVAFAFLRDEADPQTRAFFDYMRRTLGPGGPPPPQGPGGPPPGEGPPP